MNRPGRWIFTPPFLLAPSPFRFLFFFCPSSRSQSRLAAIHEERNRAKASRRLLISGSAFGRPRRRKPRGSVRAVAATEDGESSYSLFCFLSPSSSHRLFSPFPPVARRGDSRILAQRVIKGRMRGGRPLCGILSSGNASSVVGAIDFCRRLAFRNLWKREGILVCTVDAAQWFFPGKDKHADSRDPPVSERGLFYFSVRKRSIRGSSKRSTEESFD